MARRVIDLNADLGEERGADDQLIGLVSSANVTCGFHAGGQETMLATCRLALAAGVRIGAHPSYADREGFGRRPLDVAEAALGARVAYQVGALHSVAAGIGAGVAYVRAHGALYSRAAADPATAGALIEAV